VNVLTVTRGALLLLFALVALAPSTLSVTDELRSLRLRFVVDVTTSTEYDVRARAVAVVDDNVPAGTGAASASVRSGAPLSEATSFDSEVQLGPLPFVPAAGEASASHVPTRLVIDAIGVDAPITPVGLTPWGAMEAPEQLAEVGWFTQGAAPGATGRAVLAGHRDSIDGPAVFFDLEQLQRGDVVTIYARDGAVRLSYVVYDTELYPLGGAPAERIFGSNGSADLALITCGGDFTWASGYSHRVVIYARLVHT
jgi:LPXTG-site transpeptidase (sortase) family protein